MAVYNIDGDIYANFNQCPLSTDVFNAEQPLMIKGVLLKKSYVMDSLHGFFLVRILSMNRNDVSLFSKRMLAGEELDVSLRGFNVD